MQVLAAVAATSVQLPTWITTISQAILALLVLGIIASGLISVAWAGFRRWLFTEGLGRIWILISAKSNKADRVRAAYSALTDALVSEAVLRAGGTDRHLRLAKIHSAIAALELECPEVAPTLEPIARTAVENSYFDTGTARQWLRAVRDQIKHYLS